MEQVTLTANDRGGVDMVVERISNPNQPYKPVGMLSVRCGGGADQGGVSLSKCYPESALHRESLWSYKPVAILCMHSFRHVP